MLFEQPLFFLLSDKNRQLLVSLDIFTSFQHRLFFQVILFLLFWTLKQSVLCFLISFESFVAEISVLRSRAVSGVNHLGVLCYGEWVRFPPQWEKTFRQTKIFSLVHWSFRVSVV